jgi:hypothetical protein
VLLSSSQAAAVAAPAAGQTLLLRVPVALESIKTRGLGFRVRDAVGRPLESASAGRPVVAAAAKREGGSVVLQVEAAAAPAPAPAEGVSCGLVRCRSCCALHASSFTLLLQPPHPSHPFHSAGLARPPGVGPPAARLWPTLMPPYPGAVA